MHIPLDGSQISLLVAFVAGFLTFLAPCSIAIVPVQITYLASLSVENTNNSNQILNKPAFRNSLWYCFGFLLVFIVLGATVNSFARTIAPYHNLILQTLGFIFVVIALHMLRIIKISHFNRNYQFTLPRNMAINHRLYAFLLGITIAFAWTPCIGPVLAVILLWASQSATFFKSIMLLFVFGLGMVVPFLAISLCVDAITKHLKRLTIVTRIAYLLAAFSTLGLGLLLIANKLSDLFLY